MKKNSKNLASIIFTFLMVIMFTTSIVDATVYARGSGSTTKSNTSTKSSTTTKSTPKSGAKSGSFSGTSTSSGSKSNTTTNSGSSVSGRSSFHIPSIIFLPSFGGYHDSYGGYHTGYRSPSLLGSIFDIFIIIAIIWFVLWIIKKRRR